MSAKREITFKPTFIQEMMAYPKQQIAVLMEKINFLIDSPQHDGKVKKKLKGFKNLHRLRVGEYRVFYTFSGDQVCLVGLRKRDESTFDALVDEALPAKTGAAPEAEELDLDDLDDVGGLTRRIPPTFQVLPEPGAQALPRALTAEWLDDLHVPRHFHHLLLPCRTEEELLSLVLPADVHGRVIDAMFPPTLAEVLTQPTFVAQGPEDFVRYRDNHLFNFLLKLDPSQERYASWAMKGPTLIKGGAGTGKSTLALYRIKAILERPGATGRETVLFTTYTRALQAVSQQLLAQLLTPEQLGRVRIETCDRLAREIVAGTRRLADFAEDTQRYRALREARGAFEAGPETLDRKLARHALAAIPDKYFLDEFDWIIEGRGLGSLEAYQAASRPGRKLAFKPKLRAAVWELYEGYRRALAGERIETWAALRAEALRLVQGGADVRRYDHVVIDEAQDLSPVALALMAELARAPDGLFFTADTKQSIYARGFTWSHAHPRLQFKGRTAQLELNYRSTAEIDRAAFALLAPEDEETPVPSTSVQAGPMPVLLRGMPPDEEALWIVRFIRQMATHLRMKPNSAAVLVPTAKLGEALAGRMSLEGLASKFVAGRELDLESPEVKVLTLHSAKGLEFPIVVIAGLRPGSIPQPPEEDDGAALDEYAEDLQAHRKLLYVGMTRAMRGLMVCLPADTIHPVLAELGEAHWSIQEVGSHETSTIR